MSLKDEPMYEQFHAMHTRCYDQKSKDYARYGGRGIKICDEWSNSTQAYIDWAYTNGWQKGLQIDRIDVNGDYCPSNCRFVTPKENGQNRRNNIYITIDGKCRAASYWSDLVGIDRHTLYFWYHTYGEDYAIYRLKNIESLHYRQPIYCIETGEHFSSISDAAKIMFGNTNCSSPICAVCSGKRAHYRGYHFKYGSN